MLLAENIIAASSFSNEFGSATVSDYLVLIPRLASPKDLNLITSLVSMADLICDAIMDFLVSTLVYETPILVINFESSSLETGNSISLSYLSAMVFNFLSKTDS